MTVKTDQWKFSNLSDKKNKDWGQKWTSLKNLQNNTKSPIFMLSEFQK